MTTATLTKPAFTVASLVQSYISYNAWANRRLADFLKTKPSELMDSEVLSSFPTIRLTLAHILETQDFWFRVLQQKHNEPKEEFIGTAHELMDELVRNSEAFEAYANRLTEEEFQQPCYLATQWFEADKTRLEYIMHTMNHGTYHRGQIITIGRNLGFTDAPMTDYNYYILMG